MNTLFTQLSIIGLLFCCSVLNAQWVQKQSLTGSSRSFSNGFAIGNKVYVAGGFDGNSALQDFWEYDTGLNTWTQKTDLTMGFRSGAVSFTIGNKGYLCTGNNGFQYLNDLWEYDAALNTWTQKTSFPGDPRDEAVGFVIGTNAYVGTGQQFVVGPNSSFTAVYSDFYEYNSLTDTWTAKASIPGTGRAYGVGISTSNKGYAGLGGNDDQTTSYTDFYEYDPVADTWTAKASYTGTGKADAGIFSIGTDVYVLGGINFPSLGLTSACKKYDALTNVWSNEPNYGGGNVVAPICVNSNGGIFTGTGANSALSPRSDWWKFAPATTSINENELAGIQIYPALFADQLHISCGAYTGSCTVKMFDAAGKVIYTNTISTNGEIIFNTNKFSKGNYIVQLTDSKGKMLKTEKVIKK